MYTQPPDPWDPLRHPETSWHLPWPTTCLCVCPLNQPPTLWGPCLMRLGAAGGLHLPTVWYLWRKIPSRYSDVVPCPVSPGEGCTPGWTGGREGSQPAGMPAVCALLLPAGGPGSLEESKWLEKGVGVVVVVSWAALLPAADAWSRVYSSSATGIQDTPTAYGLYVYTYMWDYYR